MNLEISNNTFRYKDISYQIKNILSVNVIKKEVINKNYRPKRSVVGFNILGAALAIIAIKSFMANIGYGAIVFGLMSVVAFYTAYENIDSNKKSSSNYEPYRKILYGLSLHLLNGEKRILWSSNKEDIYKINDAVLKSMDKKKVSLSINIEITNS